MDQRIDYSWFPHQWTNDSVRQWTTMNLRNNEIMNQWTSEPILMAQPFNESMKWVNESQRISESMNQWARQQIDESVARWITESMIQRFNESMNQRISGSTIQWTNEPKVQRFNESMNQCIFPTSSSKSASRLSCFAFWSANCARAVGSFPQSRRKTAETQTRHHARKNAGFCAPECFHPWIHMLPDPFS